MKKKSDGRKFDIPFMRKVSIITYVVSILFAFSLTGIVLLIKDIDRKTPFELDSDSKFVVHRIMPNDSHIYYEVDLSKNLAIKRADYTNERRVKIKEIKLDSNSKELEEIIHEVINDESNITFSEEEEQELTRQVVQNIMAIYRIENSDNELYYVKDYVTTRKIHRIFEE